MTVDWKAAYAMSRANATIDGTLHAAFGYAVLIVGAIVALLIFAFAHEPVGAGVFAVASAIFGARQVLRGRRAGAPPHVVIGRVESVDGSVRATRAGRSDAYSVLVDVRDAFRVNADGTTTPLPGVRGSRRYACSDRQLERFKTGDEARILCLASADVVALVDDLPKL